MITEQPAPPPGGSRRPLGSSLAVAALLITVAVGALLLARWQTRPSGPAPAATAGSPAGDVRTDDAVVLYFVAADGFSLVEHPVPLPLQTAGDAVARARLIAERQLAAAPAPLASPFPAGTRVRALYITPAGDAFVDLSADVSRGHAGGSLDELFTVYALVNALTTNVPEITSVQILVEGREVDTLAGHVDLRHPLGRNLTWVSRPSGA